MKNIKITFPDGKEIICKGSVPVKEKGTLDVTIGVIGVVSNIVETSEGCYFDVDNYRAGLAKCPEWLVDGCRVEVDFVLGKIYLIEPSLV